MVLLATHFWRKKEVPEVPGASFIYELPEPPEIYIDITSEPIIMERDSKY